MLVVSSKIEQIIKVNEVNNELTLLTLWELFKKINSNLISNIV